MYELILAAVHPDKEAELDEEGGDAVVFDEEEEVFKIKEGSDEENEEDKRREDSLTQVTLAHDSIEGQSSGRQDFVDPPTTPPHSTCIDLVTQINMYYVSSY